VTAPENIMGKALRRFREDTGEIGKDFAARIGVAPSYLSELESGKRRVTSQFLGKTAVALELDPEEFTRKLEIIGYEFTPESRETETANLRETPLPYSFRTPPPNEPYFYLASHLISAMPRAEAWQLLRKLTDAAEAGDTDAALAAKALITILSEPPT
jgi:transcriptional regulator with XRE-family HTH domain